MLQFSLVMMKGEINGALSAEVTVTVAEAGVRELQATAVRAVYFRDKEKNAKRKEKSCVAVNTLLYEDYLGIIITVRGS